MKIETLWRELDAGPELEVRVFDESGRLLSRAVCCLPGRREDDEAPDLEGIERDLVETALRRAGRRGGPAQ